MKNLFNSKAIINAAFINVLIIITLISGRYTMELMDGDDMEGADIGGGLMMLLLPVLTCALIGAWRGQHNKDFTKETWIWCYGLMIILEVIIMIIAALFLKNDDIFLVNTLSVPFDTFFLIMYYGAGYFSERML